MAADDYRARAWLGSDSGAAAAEFALIVPLMVILILGTLNIGLLLYASATLHYATEDAARCGSVKTTVCTDAAAVQTYALTRYTGPTDAPTFTWTKTSTCSSVSATTSFRFITGFTATTVPLSASSCYPLQPV